MELIPLCLTKEKHNEISEKDPKDKLVYKTGLAIFSWMHTILLSTSASQNEAPILWVTTADKEEELL